MICKNLCKCTTALVAAAALLQPVAGFAQNATSIIKSAPPSSDIVARFASNLTGEPVLSAADKLALLRQKVRYVFVLFQENRSFDFYFGTFPGANGLFSKPADATPGFIQKIVDTDGSVGTISPFLIPQTVTAPGGITVPIYPADTASADHSHAGIDNSQHYVNNISLNDRFALNAEGLTTDANGNIVSKTTLAPPTSNPTLKQRQAGELVMGHVDCDTAPYLWQWADRFAMFDNFHMTVAAPSTPNALALIAGQSGLTQAALHPTQASNANNSVVSATGGEPVTADPGPLPGSNSDPSPVRPPWNSGDENPATPGLNQTYATLPLSFMGSAIQSTITHDQNPTLDLLDVQHDIKTIAGEGVAPTNWGWYQEGYDVEPTDTNGVASHSSYVLHHNAPQYFGYIADNTMVAKQHLFGLNDFFTATKNSMLGRPGGVIYVRGGYDNNDNLLPLDPNPAVRAAFPGSDDHPGYSDLQISEQLLADEVNAITSSIYWKESAIIITYDETDGLYDHQAITSRVKDPEGNPLEPSSRIPAIVISPYGLSHVIVSTNSEHSSVIKLINALFNLTPLGDLPDEKLGFAAGLKNFGYGNYGPADTVTTIGDMSDAFDNARLLGTSPVLPASYAAILPGTTPSLPHYPTGGCAMLHITPTDYFDGELIDPAPIDFNPRPSTTPGVPTSGTWTP